MLSLASHKTTNLPGTAGRRIQAEGGTSMLTVAQTDGHRQTNENGKMTLLKQACEGLYR